MLGEILRAWCNLGIEIAASQVHSSSCGFVVLPPDHCSDGDNTTAPIADSPETNGDSYLRYVAIRIFPYPYVDEGAKFSVRSLLAFRRVSSRSGPGKLGW